MKNKERWAQSYQICGFDIAALCLHARHGTCVDRMQLLLMVQEANRTALWGKLTKEDLL
jgi:hypothetical protein